MACRSPVILKAVLVIAASVALAGCPGESEPTKTKVAATPTANSIAGKSWIEPLDTTPPERWLASREAGTDLAATAPAVAEWGAVLADADARFDETPRMIANRTVQLEAMLREIGIAMSVRELLRDFATLADTGARRGFSDLCQHYYNLRARGDDGSAALAALREPSPVPTP